MNRLLPTLCLFAIGAYIRVPAVAQDYPQWGGSAARNNVSFAMGIATDWDVGEFDRKTGEWKGGRNIKWVARLGSQTYGTPIVADGRVFIGTNNGAGYLKRYPPDVDLGCLLCFRETDGAFLWQFSAEKLPTGRVHDWPMQGISATPLVEGQRIWFVSSRGEVVCLDTEGFNDDEDDGMPDDVNLRADKREADIVWKFDMMKQLGTRQHNMAQCSVTCWKDTLFACTSNGVDETHIEIPAPDAPSFIALDKRTGELLWKDNAPGTNILHGQWSSPAVGELGGVPQVIFGAGDGWLYSFRADRWKDGKPELLWKFDCNPKNAKWAIGGQPRSRRNCVYATPVIHDGRVFIATGQDPEHGEGEGDLWCIAPTRRGDVSSHLVVSKDDPITIIPHRKFQASAEDEGDRVIPNPNSAAVWHYDSFDENADGKVAFEETMHRSFNNVVVANELLYAVDFSGLVHCLDVKTGRPHFSYDLFAMSWGNPLIAEGHVYVGDEDGDVAIFELHRDAREPSREINLQSSVYSTPVVANGVLYIANKSHLFAISGDE